MFLSDLSISFPNLGIDLYDLPNKFSVFGLDIAFYGLIIGIGMIAGMIIGFREAKITGQNVENYVDLALFGIIFAVIGARLYYVVFQWDHYKDNLLEILNLRKGGLAIYGGVLAAIITCYILAKVKKLNFWQMADTGCIGLILGQIIGRWGNFFNREAFGGDSNGLFAMKINTMDPAIGGISVPEGVSYIDEANQFIQVQPTFLYESFLNLCVLLIIMAFRKKKKYHGEVFLWYMCGYGVVRAFIEGMRTDQLIIGDTGIPASQLLAIVFAIGCGVAIIYMRIKKRGCQSVWKNPEVDTEVQDELTEDEFAEEVAENTTDDAMEDTMKEAVVEEKVEEI